jgi:hypothetical protein
MNPLTQFKKILIEMKSLALETIMKTKNSIVCYLTVLLALPVLGTFAGTPAGFSIELVTTFDYPGPGPYWTQPQKINDMGDIAGEFIDLSLVQRGFIRFRNGNFSDPIVHANDTGGLTQCTGINNSRLVCGNYLDGVSGYAHGFFLRGGMFHNFDVPGSINTDVAGLNNAGDFCGYDISANGVQSAFLSVGGVITEFTVPRAIFTTANKINSSNQVCGYFVRRGAHANHGYYRDSDGTIYAPIEPAGSTGSIIFGNNDSNWMVGRYGDSGGVHGLLFIPPNTYITYDPPGSTFTSLNGINAQGEIAGRYEDASGIQHGIIARVVQGGADQSTPGVTPQRQSSQAGPLPSRSQVEELPAF